MSDPVRNPKHYEIMPGLEAIDIIEAVMRSFPDLTGYQAYCLGNFLKYRLRAGDKDDLEQDIAKSNQYKAMLNPVGHADCNGDCENCTACKPEVPMPCTTLDRKMGPLTGFTHYHDMATEYLKEVKRIGPGTYPPNWKVEHGC